LQILAIVASLQLFAPVTSSFLRGAGEIGIAVRNGILGLFLLPIAVILGCHWGTVGASAAWLFAYPIFFAHLMFRISAAFEIPASKILGALGRPALGAAIMYGVVSLGRLLLADRLNPVVTLAFLVLLGAVTYLSYSAMFGRSTALELWALVAPARNAENELPVSGV